MESGVVEKAYAAETEKREQGVTIPDTWMKDRVGVMHDMMYTRRTDVRNLPI